MALDDFALNEEEVQVEPFMGEYREGVLFVEAVDVEYEGETHTIEFDEEVEWSEGKIAVVEQLALERLKKRMSEEHLVDAAGDDSAEVGKNTQLFEALKAIATLQPCSTKELNQFLGDSGNGRSAIGNATYRGFAQAIAENGNQHYYVLTPKGWKQLVSHLGVDPQEDSKEEEQPDEESESDNEPEGEPEEGTIPEDRDLEEFGVEEEPIEEPTDQ